MVFQVPNGINSLVGKEKSAQRGGKHVAQEQENKYGRIPTTSVSFLLGSL